ncbi:MAG TPA: DUF6524 family protein [Cellvibrio sp.]|nr:DUF6524 family protein [Cellvibrio sp.]
MNLSASGILVRFLFALLLVLLTYNPSTYSYFHWVYTSWHHITPYIVIAGIILLIGWGVYINATLNSLGIIGVIAFSALLGCLVWLFIYWGFLSVSDVSAMVWVIEILLAALLTVGMCWSHFTRRMSGQVDVDEIEER